MTQKTHKCKICKGEYVKRTPMQSVCGLECAIQRDRKNKRSRAAEAEKANRARLRARREALKTKSQWTKEAQAAFNRFVRVRDAYKPCISSGRMYDSTIFGGKVDAGHYRSVGAASHLRFNLFNCHAQSKKDNRDLSGNAVEYRINLVKRIGEHRVLRLECDNEPRKFDIDYLKRIKSIFTRRARLYERIRGQV
jgi:hypothetical protein